MEQILQSHEKNRQVYELIENALTHLEYKLFETIVGFTGRIPTGPMFSLCARNNTIRVIIGQLEYRISVKSVMQHFRPPTSVGQGEMVNAILDELEHTVRDYLL